MLANENETAVYIAALEDSLQKKAKVMTELLQLTKQQQSVLEMADFQRESDDMEQFDRLVEQKEVLLSQITELDRGFDSIFAKAGNELKANKEQYRAQILQMQNAIRSITDDGVRIQGLEQKNKQLFTNKISGAKKEIRDFKVSNKTAATYYQNMANQHHAWQTYFMDQKK